MSKKLIEALHKIVAAKQLYFHGTSSKFLRSILKNGVLPTTKEGVWRDAYKEEDTNAMNPSKKSLDSSYWTASAMTATKYANEGARKLGGNPLYIAATLETKTTLPDEDDFLSVIGRGLDKLWGEGATTGNSERAWVETYYSIVLNKKHGKEAIKRWRKLFADWLDGLYKNNKYATPDYYKYLDRLLVSELRRRISYMSDYDYKSLTARILDSYLYPKKVDWDNLKENFPQPNSKKEEDNRRHYIDLLSRKIKKLVDVKGFSPTLRITTPVKFSGANKIVMLLETIETKEGDNTVYKFKVHYGSIPPEFISAWKERMGYKFEIISKVVANQTNPLDNLPEIKWSYPTDKEIDNEIKTEFKIESLFIASTWPKEDEYKQATVDLKDVSKPEKLDPKKLKGYHIYKSYDDLYNNVKSFGGPKDPESMLKAIRDNKPLPMPIVVRRRNGGMEVLGGATRSGLALLADQFITALVIDEIDANELMADRLEHSADVKAEKEGAEEIYDQIRDYFLSDAPKPTYDDKKAGFQAYLAACRFARIAKLRGIDITDKEKKFT